MDTREKCMAVWKEFRDGDITLEQLIAALEIIKNYGTKDEIKTAKQTFGATETRRQDD